LRVAFERKDWQLSNRVCWFGSIHRFEKMVLPACEQAVALAPEAGKIDVTDSRGLARALAGNTAGALKDFTATLESLKVEKDMGGYDAAFLQRREGWIAALKEGRNPFNEALLKSLRIE
jgi:hypothetical protein